jgi:hypothetical protein
VSSAPNRRGGLLLFLAERYLPRASEHVARADAKQAREASELLTQEGTDVSYLGSALIPADQMCFAVFEAHSAEQVEQLIARAAIPYDHVVEAVRLRENGNEIAPLVHTTGPDSGTP